MRPTTDIKGAAELMKVHPKTVEGLIHSCAIPAAKVGKAYVILTRDVMGFIENQIAKQTAERMMK